MINKIFSRRLSLIFIMVLLMLSFSGCGQSDFYSTNAIKGKDAFNQAEEEYLVYFYMPSCTHCQDFKPTLEEYVTKENALKMYKVNIQVQSERNTWVEYNIKGTPTLFHIKTDNNGKKVLINELVGVQELDSIPTSGK